MAERCGDAMARSVTGDSVGVDANDFGRCLHGCAVSKAASNGQYGEAIPVGVAAPTKSDSLVSRGESVPIYFAPENTPFMVALALLALLALTQLFGFSFGSDADLDHPDGDVGLGAGVASLLGIGRLPLLAWLSLFLTVFALGGLTAQQLLEGLIGYMLPAVPAGGLMLVAALPVTGLLARPLARIWPSDETTAIDIEALLAKRGRIEVGSASRGNPARAAVRDSHGQMHLVMVEPHEDDARFAQGDEVLLVRRDGELFYAIACDPPFLAGE